MSVKDEIDMTSLDNTKRQSVPLLWQLIVIIAQFGIYLFINWLDVYLDQNLPYSALDKFFWWVIVPMTWLIYTSMSYHYSHKLLRAVLQGLLQTIFSYTIVIASVLFFYTWIGKSF